MSSTASSLNSKLNSDITVRWNYSVVEGGLNESVFLQLEKAKWLTEAPVSWSSWGASYIEDTGDEREIARSTSNPSERQIFRLNNNETVKIHMRTSTESFRKSFTIDYSDKYWRNRHMVVELYPRDATLSYFLDGPTTIETVTDTFSRAAGIAQNVSQNAFDTLAAVPGVLSSAAYRISQIARKVTNA